MKIAVIGATGTVGAGVVTEATKRGHLVIAIARKHHLIPHHSNVTAISADVNSPNFSQQLEGVDAVISAFNGGWSNPNVGLDFTKGAQSITDAVKQAKVPYLLVVGGAGSLYIKPNTQLIDTPEFPKEIYDGANAARNWLKDLQNRRDIHWSFISPPAAFNGDINTRTGKYRIGKDDVLFTGDQFANISLPDLACAIIDEVENKTHLFTRFTVAEL